MNIQKPNSLREKVISKLLGLVYRLDNSGNADFEMNGEKIFITDFIGEYKDRAPVIFDVGANKGAYTEVFINQLGDAPYLAHLFEPQKSCFLEIQKKFQDNKKIIVNNFGLSDANMEVSLYKDEEGSGLASLYNRDLVYYGYEMNTTEEISVQRADTYIVQNNIPHIHLLKLDVEGHEINALKGFGEFLNPEFIDYIQFEYGGANLDAHTNLLDFYHLLESKGFTVCKIKKSYLEIRAYNPRFENFINQNYVAVSVYVQQPLIVACFKGEQRI